MTDRDDDHNVGLPTQLLDPTGSAIPPALGGVRRDESYWTARNALVDAVHAAGRRLRYSTDGAMRLLPGQEAEDAAYGVALDALKAFDAAHGGAPIL
jgi:hypothetical protein